MLCPFMMLLSLLCVIGLFFLCLLAIKVVHLKHLLALFLVWHCVDTWYFISVAIRQLTQLVNAVSMSKLVYGIDGQAAFKCNMLYMVRYVFSVDHGL